MPKTPTKDATPRSHKKKGSFRITAKKFFITFPQTDTSKQAAFDAIKARYGDSLDYYAVVSEKHGDGHPHLHILVGFKKRHEVSTADHFDFITGKHGDVKSAKGLGKLALYMTKEDTDPLQFNIDLKYLAAGAAPKTTQVVKAIKDGKTLQEIRDKFPEFYLMQKNKVQDFYNDELKMKANLLAEKMAYLDIEYTGTDHGTALVVEWLAANLKKPRTFKQSQLFLHGPTNSRKTSLVLYLEKFFRIYWVPHDQWWDLYADADYDLIVFDEFKGQKTLQEMNRVLEGSLVLLNVKGSRAIKASNKPCVILSNYCPRDCYPKVDQAKLDTLMARLEEITLVNPLDLDGIRVLTESAPYNSDNEN